MIRSNALLIAVLLLSGAPIVQAQTPAAHETDARVPALESFHVTIYKIWHTAWPKKDVTMLVALLPDVQKGSSAVASAALPGILRDKEAAWNAGVSTLRDRVTEYAAAARAMDTVALLGAAEHLHAQYEALVRTIRPMLKEVGAFHEVLYVLYHYHVPALAMDSIRVRTAALKERMAALNGAALPQRLLAKQDAFTASRVALSSAVDAFVAATATSDHAAITTAMQKVHTAYQNLEKTFD
jgi:hypothetical protein